MMKKNTDRCCLSKSGDALGVLEDLLATAIVLFELLGEGALLLQTAVLLQNSLVRVLLQQTRCNVDDYARPMVPVSDNRPGRAATFLRSSSFPVAVTGSGRSISDSVRVRASDFAPIRLSSYSINF